MDQNMTPELWEQIEGVRMSVEANPTLNHSTVEGLSLGDGTTSSAAAMQAVMLSAMGWSVEDMALATATLMDGEDEAERYQVLQVELNIDGRVAPWLIMPDRVVSVASLTGVHEVVSEDEDAPPPRLRWLVE